MNQSQTRDLASAGEAMPNSDEALEIRTRAPRSPGSSPPRRSSVGPGAPREKRIAEPGEIEQFQDALRRADVAETLSLVTRLAEGRLPGEGEGEDEDAEREALAKRPAATDEINKKDRRIPNEN